MRRLICAFVVRILNKQVFSWRGPYYWPLSYKKMWLFVKYGYPFRSSDLFRAQPIKLVGRNQNIFEISGRQPAIWKQTSAFSLVIRVEIEHTTAVNDQMIWATSWENLLMQYANNKGAEQRRISAFVVCRLGSIISPASTFAVSWL